MKDISAHSHNTWHSKPEPPAGALHKGKQLRMRCIRFIVLISNAPEENYDKEHIPSFILASTFFLVPVATLAAE